MRRILHPGTPSQQRVQVTACQARVVEFELPLGRSLLATLSDALACRGANSGVLRLQGGAFFPLAYVMPELSRTPEHAVYFSDRFEAPSPVRLESACVTFGQRDAGPWLHCHAVWREADGTRRCGHLLPEECVVVETVQASLCLLQDAEFRVRPDAESRFSLFKPEALAPAGRADPARAALAVQVGPNEDICSAIESACRDHGVVSATVHGGVGSLVGAAFEDGSTVEPFVTEVLVRAGRVYPDAEGAPRAQLDVELVDYLGGMAQGRLQRGRNAVLVTFELVLVPD